MLFGCHSPRSIRQIFHVFSAWITSIFAHYTPGVRSTVFCLYFPNCNQIWTLQWLKKSVFIPCARMFHCMTLIGRWLLEKLVLRFTKSLWNRAGRFWRTTWHSSSRSLGSMGSKKSGSVCSKYSWCLETAPVLRVFARALYSLLVLLPMEYTENEAKKRQINHWRHG